MVRERSAGRPDGPPRPSRPEGGMVTVELAMVSVLVAAFVALLGWGALQLLALDQCQLAAHEVARQAARGDAVAVRRASAGVPLGAEVRVSDAAGAMSVVVRFTPRLLGMAVGELEARATVLDEAKE